jgi:hypothetical protein
MKKKTLIYLFIVASALTGCLRKEIVADSKTSCYNKKLENLKTSELYQAIQSSFADTFPSLSPKSKSMLYKIDEAVFLSSDKTKCILAVLEKVKGVDDLGFGSARLYQGDLVNGKWVFSESIWMTYEEDYYEKYSENSFENIAEITRASILTHGAPALSDCDIDEHYWFVEMQD